MTGIGAPIAVIPAKAGIQVVDILGAPIANVRPQHRPLFDHRADDPRSLNEPA